MKLIRVLSIETSCDETSVAIVDSNKNIVAHDIFSQLEHNKYGGVVPELAARFHMHKLGMMITDIMQETHFQYQELDAIAVTAGPGLIGGLIVGLMFAKGLAMVNNLPLITINHLEGHALTIRLTSNIEYPFLLLLISGGHCQFVNVSGFRKYRILGSSLDDALGECFDKVAKMLDLGYPGGKIVEKYAKMGNEGRFSFPVPLYKKHGCNFSFSGLKTAVKNEIMKFGKNITLQDKYDICASFQYTIAEILADRISNAINMYRLTTDNNNFVMAGGVAANLFLRQKTQAVLRKYGFILHVPPVELCTDNAAMIAWAGIESLLNNRTDGLDFEPKARWSLENTLI